jgi:hypothetical protein
LLPIGRGFLLQVLPTLWPFFGMAMLSVGILLRKQRIPNLAMDKQLFDVVMVAIFTGFALLLEIILAGGFTAIAAAPLAMAAVVSGFFTLLRITQGHIAAGAGSLVMSLLTCAGTTTIMLHANWEVEFFTSVRDATMYAAIAVTVLWSVLCLIELGMIVRNRQHLPASEA